MVDAVVWHDQPVTRADAARRAAAVAASPWFQRGFALVRELGRGRPLGWVWILPPGAAREADLIFGIPVKIIDGVEPHLAIELPTV